MASQQRRAEIFRLIEGEFTDFKPQAEVLEAVQEVCEVVYRRHKDAGPHLNEDYFSWCVDLCLWGWTCEYSLYHLFVCHR